MKDRTAELMYWRGSGLDNEGIRIRFSVGEINFSSLHSVQINSVTHLASYRMGTGAFSSRGKSSRGMELTTPLHLMPRLKMVKLYTHSTIHLHGMVRTGIILPLLSPSGIQKQFLPSHALPSSLRDQKQQMKIPIHDKNLGDPNRHKDFQMSLLQLP